MANKLDGLIARIGHIQGVTGLPTERIKRVAAQRGIDLNTASIPDIYKAVTGREMLGPAKEFVSPQVRPEPKGEVLSFDDRIANDPSVAAAIQENMHGLPADVAEGVARRDPQAIMRAYQMIVEADGALPARQMELPLSAPEASPGTGLVPFGVRGPGVAGDLSGPGAAIDPGTGLIPAPLRGIPGPGPRRLGTAAGVRGPLSGPGVAQAGPRGLSTDVDLPRLGYQTSQAPESADWLAWARRMATDSGLDTPANRRIAAGIGTALAGGAAMLRGRPTETEATATASELEDDAVALTSTDGTAELAEETSPIPESTPVAPAPPQAPAQAPPQAPPQREPFQHGIVLSEIPESAVPYTVTPDVMTARAGLGFGGTASTARMQEYKERLIERGYSPSEAEELAYLEEKHAWKVRADAGLKRKERGRSNVDANLDASASPIEVEPTAGGGHMSVPSETPAQKMDRMEGYKQADARMQRFEADYNAATGHPEYGYDESGNPAKLGKVDIDKQSAVERAGRRAAAYHFDAPYNSELESENNPMSDERRAQIAADWDQAVARQEAQWALADSQRDLQNKREAEKYGHGNNSQITKDQLAARYERRVAEDRMRQDPSVVEARIKRMAKSAGISMSEARDLYESGMEANGGGQTFDEFRRGTQALRDKATDRRLAQQQKAEDNWRATAMLAGGSQNLNSGNRWIANALAQKSPEQQEQAMRYMLPGGDRRALVDAQNMENANDVIKRFLTSGAAAGLNNPAQAAAIQQQQLQQQQEMVDWAEKHVNEKYAWDADSWLPGSEFTEAERTQTINALMNRYGTPNGSLTLADATRIVDNIGSRKPRPRAAQAGSQPAGAMPTDGWAPPTSM